MSSFVFTVSLLVSGYFNPAHTAILTSVPVILSADDEPPASKCVGKWRNVGKDQTIEITESGTVLWNDRKGRFAKYHITIETEKGKRYYKLDFFYSGKFYDTDSIFVTDVTDDPDNKSRVIFSRVKK